VDAMYLPAKVLALVYVCAATNTFPKDNRQHINTSITHCKELRDVVEVVFFKEYLAFSLNLVYIPLT
jgi:hypothetical protein